ncbi:MAG: hypothetical protein ACRDRT_02725, partial [Pseudonocardiaceae bacterium]
GAGQTSFLWQGLSNAVGPYTFTVVASNSVGPGPASSPSAGVYAFGTPPTPAPPAASGAVSPDQTTTTITVNWPAIGQCNDAQACAGYIVTELKDGQAGPSETVAGTCTACGASFGPIANNGARYTYQLQAVGEQGKASGPSAPSAPAIIPRGIPGPITGLVARPGDTSIAVSFNLPQAVNGASIGAVNYTVSGGSNPITGSWSSPGSAGQTVGETISGLTNGTTYSLSVSACNSEGLCSSSSSATADPYGVPNPPTVTANQSGSSIVYAWSGGGNNGRPLTAYQVCIEGTCSGRGASPGTTTISHRCTQGPFNITATVTDSVGQTSPNSATASASTVACAQPNSPSVSANANGNSITYNWSGGGGNTLAITQYVVCIDGSCSNQGPNPGSTNNNYGCQQSHSVYAYVVDELGHQSPNSPTASATTGACPSVQVYEGAQGTTSACPGSNPSCHYLGISMRNFAPNTAYTVWLSTDCGGPGSPEYANCVGTGPNPGTTNYASKGVTTDGNGSYDNGQFGGFGYVPAQVWVNVGAPNPGGVMAPMISWHN